MADEFGSGSWLEAPTDASDAEAVNFMAEQGAISSKPIKHRKARKTNENQERVEGAEGFEKEKNSEDSENSKDPSNPENKKQPRRIYIGNAFDASEFLKLYESFKFVYFSQSWWEYSEETGWETVSDAEMEFKLADFLRRRMLKLTQRSASDLLFALNPFCNIRQSAKVFEPTWFLTRTADGMEAQHAPGWMACKNQLLHVPSVAKSRKTSCFTAFGFS